jgi:uncharacterized protein YciI
MRRPILRLQQRRPAHIERLNRLKDEGRLILAGPHPAIDNNEPGEAGFTGSLVVAEFDCLEEAQTWVLINKYKLSFSSQIKV